ncbi:MAG: TauD/TfdA family dioxygenase [Pseudohongiellaceae bacterium]
MKNYFDTITVTDQQEHSGSSFPLALANPQKDLSLEDLIEGIAQQKSILLRQLQIHGAILFRGYPVSSAEDFDRFLSAFDLPNFTYSESLSNAVRTNRTEKVFTANEAPASVSIYLHHEMAQTPVFPAKLFFYCEHAAEAGGATPLCRSDILLERLALVDPEFVEKCETLGVRYSNTMPEEDDAESGQGRSWRSTLSADTASAAESKLAELGYAWEWLDQGNLRVTSPVLPAVKHSSDGRRVFFNQLIAAFRGWKDSRNVKNKAITFGDGSEIPVESMAKAIELGDELSFDVPWQTGDIALVDNYLVMHGRRPFQGQRRVLASLVSGSN